jgi:hypothetical protein
MCAAIHRAQITACRVVSNKKHESRPVQQGDDQDQQRRETEAD